jgi:hypothetical protein
MTKKSRVKNGSLWGNSPTDKQEATAQHDTSVRSIPEPSSQTAKTKSTTKAKPKVSDATNKKQRTIFIAFNKATGDIVATQELMLDNANDSEIPWSEIPADVTAKSFKLTGELADKQLIEIHTNYKVTGSGKLELKQR